MVLRLTFVTFALAMFAVGFSELVDHAGRGTDRGAWSSQSAANDCFDQGAVCAPRFGG